MKLFNTQTKSLEDVKPVKPGIVTMYTCGPTVYDYPHIGNWFAFIRWDILARTIKDDYELNWVMNITDVGHLVSDDDEGEDKLEKGAKRENKTAWQVASYYGEYFINALDRLNFIEITKIPKATDHIDEQIALVKNLENIGYTYVIDDGVYFDTTKLKDYGKLANLKLDDLKAGARVEMCPGKKNLTDFALWKFSPKSQKRDMEWDSPWGKGFPGWHIECSAMSMKYLGDTIDIHCGGIDHIPVHHTNEIAQSEPATGKTFSNIWVHSNFIKVDGRKMSKSLGNLITLEDIENKGYTLQEFRLLVLESHYRNESQFTWDILEASKNRLKRWQSVADLRHQPLDKINNETNMKVKNIVSKVEQSIRTDLKDDLNTPSVLSAIDAALNDIYSSSIATDDKVSLESLLKTINHLLGINLLKDQLPDELQSLIAQRYQARKDKDWKKADEIRNELEKSGILIKDTQSGQIWERS